jgi:hypothetical protein
VAARTYQGFSCSPGARSKTLSAPDAGCALGAGHQLAERQATTGWIVRKLRCGLRFGSAALRGISYRSPASRGQALSRSRSRKEGEPLVGPIYDASRQHVMRWRLANLLNLQRRMKNTLRR